jgi:hypothetical protein
MGFSFIDPHDDWMCPLNPIAAWSHSNFQPPRLTGEARGLQALLSTNVDAASQFITTFKPQPDATVRGLALTQDLLFVAGDFTKISGQDRKAVAALDPQKGQETNPLDAQITGQGQVQARAVLPLGQAMYVGGQLRGAECENRGRIASIHPTFGGAASGWDPGADLPINAVGNSEKVILIGGEFIRLGLRGVNPNPSVDGQPVQYLAAFDARPAILNFHTNAARH